MNTETTNADADAEETRLMAAVAGGDEEAFTVLINRYQHVVYNYFYRMGRDPQQAEDGSQETFLRLYRHAGQYRPQAKLVTYLLTIARNCLIDQARRKKANETPLADREIPDRRETPEKEAERGELRAQVDAALLALPEFQREPVVLAVVEDIPYETVAEILGVPLGTVKSRVFYGLKALRENLQKKGYRPGCL